MGCSGSAVGAQEVRPRRSSVSSDIHQPAQQQVICEKYDAGHNKWVMKGEHSRFLRGEQYRESVVSTNGDHQPALSLEVFGSSVF